MFTQVWLYSIAAFAFGVLLTWLLFVLPLRRRAAGLAADLREAWSSVTDDAPDDDREDDPRGGPFDLLEPDRTGESRDGPTETGLRWDDDDPVDLHRAVTTAPYVTRRSAAASDGAAAADQDPPTRPAEPRADAPAFPASAEAGAGAAEGTADSAAGTAEPPHRSSDEADAEQAQPGSRWQRPVLNGTAGEHGIEEADGSGPRGSLFEPEADSTQVIPKVDDEGEPPPLPRRTPGSGPRPGREGGGGGAPVVKGHSASRQYHTPASPHYADIAADVWFRTPGDAEIAGFEPWDGRRVR
nr:hypothetical protein [Saccharopolyspora sp. HNM0983]